MPVETLRQLVAAGEVVIPANKNHTSLVPEGVGKNCRTKINVNLGVSRTTIIMRKNWKSPQRYQHEGRSHHGFELFWQNRRF